MTELPRQRGKALGHRSWVMEGHSLRSAVLGGVAWRPGPNRATCRREHYLLLFPPFSRQMAELAAHPAPHNSCACGLYAFHELTEEWQSPDLTLSGQEVAGAVLGWGRMCVHPSGFRAEYAEPVILAYGRYWRHEHVLRVQALAGELGLPCVELADLKRKAASFGEVIPSRLRPQTPPVPDRAPPPALAGYSHHAFGSHHWPGGTISFGTATSLWPLKRPSWVRRHAFFVAWSTYVLGWLALMLFGAPLWWIVVWVVACLAASPSIGRIAARANS